MAGGSDVAQLLHRRVVDLDSALAGRPCGLMVGGDELDSALAGRPCGLLVGGTNLTALWPAALADFWSWLELEMFANRGGIASQVELRVLQQFSFLF